MSDNESTEQRYSINLCKKREKSFLAYHLFGKLKKSLCENNLCSVDDVKRAVQAWIKQTPVAFFENGIMDLVPCW